MFDQNIILFSTFVLAGFFIIIIGFKFSNTTRKVIETIGAITFHVGVFGILYHKVSISLFISLFTLVIALFILLDPLKIAGLLNDKIYKIFGYLILCAAIAFGIQFLIGFPVWPWIIPIVIYLAPFLVSPLKKIQKIILFLVWALLVFYTVMIALVLYGGFNPNFDSSFITKHFSQTGYLFLNQQDLPKTEPTQPKTKKQDKKETITKTQNIIKDKKEPDPKDKKQIKKDIKKEATPQLKPKKKEKTNTGPYLKSLEKADEEFVKLEKKHKELKEKYNELLKKTISLEKEIQELKDLVNEE